MTNEIPQSERIDKWLWHARFFKSRTQASDLVKSKKLRLNSLRISKPSVLVRVGDILTFSKANDVKVIEILAFATRRGPASEAQLLYKDLSPDPIFHDPLDPRTMKIPTREQGMGRPTKADRRALDKLRNTD